MNPDPEPTSSEPTKPGPEPTTKPARPRRPVRPLLMRYPVNLPEGIRSSMGIAGMTGLDLARKAGLHHNTLGHFLQQPGTTRARVPRSDQLRRITAVLAPAMGVTVESLWWEFGRLLDQPSGE